MKFGQLTKNNIRNIYLEKSHTNGFNIQNIVHKLFPDPFLKNQSWEYLWINSLTFYTVFFYYMPSWRLLKYIETMLYKPFTFTSCKAILERDLEKVSMPYLLEDFWFKIFFLSYSINWLNFIAWLSLLREELGNICILII